MPKNEQSKLICLLLGLFTIALFWPVTGFDFVNFDDQDYIVNNAAIHDGVTWPALLWAFKSAYASNWHPVTWMSHMVDCGLYGPRAGGHHLTNVLLHAANVILLFLLLKAMTGAMWRSAFVAALFGWHPLHVESVAWVSERKDVLSTFFALLTLAAYARYATESKASTPLDAKSEVGRTRRGTFYAAALVLFALGLMAKPILVTLPFVMLLLDYWPLKRTDGSRMPGENDQRAPGWPKLVLEKVPFLALAALDSAATVWAQKGANSVVSWKVLPLSDRMANALVSYILYLKQMAWPANLAVIYPWSHEWSLGIAAGAGAVLLAITAWAVAQAGNRPWFIVGWLWYLGTLLPVIGLMQVGMQSMADRYAYIPSIGIFIITAWGVCAWLERRPAASKPVWALAALVLVALMICARIQLGYWRNSVTLFSRAVAVSPDSIMAEYNLAEALARTGDPEHAASHYLRAIEIHPNRVEAAYNSQTVARFNLGAIYAGQGRWPEAEAQFREILRGEPDHTRAHEALGTVLTAEGRSVEASGEFHAVTQLEPANAKAWHELGMALSKTGRDDDALNAYREAVQLSPDNSATLNDLAWLLATLPDAKLRGGAEALRLAQRACDLTQSQDPLCLATLDAAYAETGQFPKAIEAAQETKKVALANNRSDLAAEAGKRIALYRVGKPYHGG